MLEVTAASKVGRYLRAGKTVEEIIHRLNSFDNLAYTQGRIQPEKLSYAPLENLEK